ncbi:uncharacterized protein KGF55_003656 [Candida pseudojiufengensis]|uniref:uncharacterized protein n=1 Tax=Candida pseudojiufengensis TaxID=497109 RepID=UPI002225A857|nr:uncharacterized protein KGF55_003656 [Candida pseudojiufengensis]KAI5962580.1 hypothetical protein KGF55_003656 [Candida pseudojiufengensis]
MTDIETYKDPIISLIKDPNLNKDQTKSSKIIHLIQEISERKLNKLCSSSFIILQTLEKIQLKFKSWEFLSLDYNSDTHFANKDDNIKIFNTGIADKVMNICIELNHKMIKISSDIDFISKSSKMLSIRDLMSDDGTMLTSLILRIIKLKNEVIEQLSISYSKSKLILIGRDLELLNKDDNDNETIDYYKTFIISLLKQLNDAILINDFDQKYECLAVINDLEKMFEKYKLEKMIDKSIEEHDQLRELEESNTRSQQQQQQQHTHDVQQQHLPISRPQTSLFDDDDTSSNGKDSQSPDETFSEYSMTSSTQLPMVHSITHQKHDHLRHDSSSIYDYSSSSNMYKSTISEELPYLMTAFSSAKNIKEDISHYEQENNQNQTQTTNNKKQSKYSNSPTKENQKQTNTTSQRKPYFPKSNLPESSLYSQSKILKQSNLNYTSSILNNNNELLRKLGIRPQVINIPEDQFNELKKKEEQQKQKQHLQQNRISHFKDNRLLLTEENILHLNNDILD